MRKEQSTTTSLHNMNKIIDVEHDNTLTWDWPLSSAVDGNVKVIDDKDHFEVDLDAKYFTPNEIEVKAIGDLIEVHLEHKSRPTDTFGGMVSRSIMRCYHMPQGTDPKTLRSSLDKDGVLHITAMKKY